MNKLKLGLIVGVGIGLATGVAATCAFFKMAVNQYCKGEESKLKNRFDPIGFQTKEDAETVLDDVLTLMQDYGVVTVADLHDLSGITGKFEDSQWGWTTLEKMPMYTRKSKYGYTLILPRPELLKDKTNKINKIVRG